MRGACDRLALQGARWSGEVLVIADVAPASHFAIRAAILVRAQTAFSPLTYRAVLFDGLTSGLEVDAVLQVVQQCEVLERDQCGDVPSSMFEAESDALCRGRFAVWTRCRVLRNISQARVLLACECSGTFSSNSSFGGRTLRPEARKATVERDPGVRRRAPRTQWAGAVLRDSRKSARGVAGGKPGPGCENDAPLGGYRCDTKGISMD